MAPPHLGRDHDISPPAQNDPRLRPRPPSDSRDSCLVNPVSKGFGPRRPARSVRGHLHGRCAGASGRSPPPVRFSLSGIFRLRSSLPHQSSRLGDQIAEVPLRLGADVAPRLVGTGLGGALIAPDQRIVGEGGGKAVDQLREAPLPLANAVCKFFGEEQAGEGPMLNGPRQSAKTPRSSDVPHRVSDRSFLPRRRHAH
jgi:hypothetical protein